jgi:glycine betaine/proline transport system substrate-binding protein
MSRTALTALTALACAALLAACGKSEPAGSATASSEATSQACGQVSVASMSWQSAEVLAQVDRLILSSGYGCKVELIPGDTLPTLTSMMDKGQPDVAPEAWISALRQPLDEAVSEGRLHYAARVLLDGGMEGWWIPRYLADAHPDIRTIDDALARPGLFPSSEDKSKGAVHNCPAGWHCQITTANAFKAWDAASKGFVLLDTGSAGGLDGSIARAHERKEGWLGYYWAPTAMVGRYDMVRLDPGVPHDRQAWDSCNARPDCDQPRQLDWPRSEVFTVVTDRFQKTGGPAIGYLQRRAWNTETVNALLAWMSLNQADAEAGARHFLRTQPDVWQSWVEAEVAEKVRASL